MRSEALEALAVRLRAAADELRGAAGALAAGAEEVARCRSPDVGVVVAVAPVLARALAAAGPGGLWGEALHLDALAVAVGGVARLYAEVETGVAALLRGVAAGADVAARGGWLGERGARVVVHPVAPRWSGSSLAGPGDLVAAGEALGGGRVRVLEVAGPGGRSSWVVVVPGTQSWDPRAGADPFDVTTDVRAVTGEVTLAAAGVTAALDRARGASPRARPDDPVLLVGHSQGGILAAALASDAGFRRGHHVTHVLTTGAPVGVFALPADVRVLSVEHRDDPVPRLDLTPNAVGGRHLTVRAGDGAPVDVRRHALEEYERTVRAAAGAPPGTVPGLTGWEASAGGFLGRPVVGVTEVVLSRDT